MTVGRTFAPGWPPGHFTLDEFDSRGDPLGPSNSACPRFLPLSLCRIRRWPEHSGISRLTQSRELDASLWCAKVCEGVEVSHERSRRVRLASLGFCSPFTPPTHVIRYISFQGITTSIPMLTRQCHGIASSGNSLKCYILEFIQDTCVLIGRPAA